MALLCMEPGLVRGGRRWWGAGWPADVCDLEAAMLSAISQQQRLKRRPCADRTAAPAKKHCCPAAAAALQQRQSQRREQQRDRQCRRKELQQQRQCRRAEKQQQQQQQQSGCQQPEQQLRPRHFRAEVDTGGFRPADVSVQRRGRVVTVRARRCDAGVVRHMVQRLRLPPGAQPCQLTAHMIGAQPGRLVLEAPELKVRQPPATVVTGDQRTQLETTVDNAVQCTETASDETETDAAEPTSQKEQEIAVENVAETCELKASSEAVHGTAHCTGNEKSATNTTVAATKNEQEREIAVQNVATEDEISELETAELDAAHANSEDGPVEQTAEPEMEDEVSDDVPVHVIDDDNASDADGEGVQTAVEAESTGEDTRAPVPVSVLSANSDTVQQTDNSPVPADAAAPSPVDRTSSVAVTVPVQHETPEPQLYRATVDVSQFSAHQVSASGAGRRLTVRAERRERPADGGVSSTRLERHLWLPADVDPQLVAARLTTDGQLVLEAPRHSAPGRQRDADTA